MKKATAKAQTDEFKSLMRLIKNVLRERSLSYRDLAKKLSLSESGVKKIFSGDDCSYQRLASITKILGLKISDLLQELEHQELKPVRFTTHQQTALLKNRAAFYFYVKLVIERLSVDEIQAESRLTSAQVFKYLKFLDELNLVVLLPENKVKIPEITLVRDFGSGPLLEKTYQTWAHKIVDDLAFPKNQESAQFIIRCLKMKKETYANFLNQLKELEQYYAKRALQEMAISTKNLIVTRWISLSDQQSFIAGPIDQID